MFIIHTSQMVCTKRRVIGIDFVGQVESVSVSKKNTLRTQKKTFHAVHLLTITLVFSVQRRGQNLVTGAGGHKFNFTKCITRYIQLTFNF